MNDLIEQQVDFFFVRHGQIEAEQVLAGQTDFELSELGKQTLDASLLGLQGSVQQVMSSPLKRCSILAELFASEKELPLFIESNIQEMNFGDWDGKSYNELWQHRGDSGTIGDFWQNPWVCSPPNGESMKAFNHRVVDWWQQQLLKPELSSCMVVTHAGVIKQILSHILSGDTKAHDYFNRIQIKYGAVIRISVFRDRSGKAWPQLHF